MHQQNVRLSRKFVLTISAACVFLAGLFLYFLHHYTPKERTVQAETMNLDTTASREMIRTVLHESESDVDSVEGQGDADLHNNKNVTSNDDVSNTAIQASQNPPLDSEQLEEVKRNQAAAESPISAYNNEHLLQTSEPAATKQEPPQIKTPDNQSFLDKASNNIKTTIQDGEHPPHTPYEIKAGHLIHAILETSINSDLPGKIVAKVSENVYDTVTGNFLLIPQGTTLLGVYDPNINYGQGRIQIVWQRLLFPNGYSMQLNGQPGVDLEGHAGLHDKVDHHYFQLYSHAALFSVLTAAGQLSQSKHQRKDLNSPQTALYAATGQEMMQVNAKVIDKNLGMQPTIEIRPGTHFNVMLAEDLVLHDYYHFN